MRKAYATLFAMFIALPLAFCGLMDGVVWNTNVWPSPSYPVYGYLQVTNAFLVSALRAFITEVGDEDDIGYLEVGTDGSGIGTFSNYWTGTIETPGAAWFGYPTNGTFPRRWNMAHLGERGDGTGVDVLGNPRYVYYRWQNLYPPFSQPEANIKELLGAAVPNYVNHTLTNDQGHLTNMPPEMWSRTGLLSHIGAPTNWFEVSPRRRLNVDSNGWRWVPAICSNLRWTVKVCEWTNSVGYTNGSSGNIGQQVSLSTNYQTNSAIADITPPWDIWPAFPDLGGCPWPDPSNTFSEVLDWPGSVATGASCGYAETVPPVLTLWWTNTINAAAGATYDPSNACTFEYGETNSNWVVYLSASNSGSWKWEASNRVARPVARLTVTTNFSKHGDFYIVGPGVPVRYAGTHEAGLGLVLTGGCLNLTNEIDTTTLTNEIVCNSSVADVYCEESFEQICTNGYWTNIVVTNWVGEYSGDASGATTWYDWPCGTPGFDERIGWATWGTTPDYPDAVTTKLWCATWWYFVPTCGVCETYNILNYQFMADAYPGIRTYGPDEGRGMYAAYWRTYSLGGGRRHISATISDDDGAHNSMYEPSPSFDGSGIDCIPGLPMAHDPMHYPSDWEYTVETSGVWHTFVWTNVAVGDTVETSGVWHTFVWTNLAPPGYWLYFPTGTLSTCSDVLSCYGGWPFVSTIITQKVFQNNADSTFVMPELVTETICHPTGVSTGWCTNVTSPSTCYESWVDDTNNPPYVGYLTFEYGEVYVTNYLVNNPWGTNTYGIPWASFPTGVLSTCSDVLNCYTGTTVSTIITQKVFQNNADCAFIMPRRVTETNCYLLGTNILWSEVVLEPPECWFSWVDNTNDGTNVGYLICETGRVYVTNYLVNNWWGESTYGITNYWANFNWNGAESPQDGYPDPDPDNVMGYWPCTNDWISLDGREYTGTMTDVEHLNVQVGPVTGYCVIRWDVSNGIPDLR